MPSARALSTLETEAASLGCTVKQNKTEKKKRKRIRNEKGMGVHEAVSHSHGQYLTSFYW